MIGISGGVSYGALGMTHHSTQDFAVMASLTGMRVYDPSDRFQTAKLIEALLKDKEPAYIRVSRSATEDVYDENINFELNKANRICEGKDVLIVSCGELLPYAKKAVEQLHLKGISAGLLDMYCIKPYDETALIEMAKDVRLVVTVEEHLSLIHISKSNKYYKVINMNITKKIQIQYLWLVEMEPTSKQFMITWNAYQM